MLSLGVEVKRSRLQTVYVEEKWGRALIYSEVFQLFSHLDENHQKSKTFTISYPLLQIAFWKNKCVHFVCWDTFINVILIACLLYMFLKCLYVSVYIYCFMGIFYG